MFTRFRVARQHDQEEGSSFIEAMILISIIALLLVIGVQSFTTISQKVAETDETKQIIEQTKEAPPVLDPISIMPVLLSLGAVTAVLVFVIGLCYFLWNRKSASPKQQAYHAGRTGEYYNHEHYRSGIFPRKSSTLRASYLAGVGERATQNRGDRRKLDEQLIETEMYKNNDMEAIEFYLTQGYSNIR